MSRILGKNTKHKGNPCVNCGWPDIENKKYVDKYSYTLYDMLNVSKIKAPIPAHRQKKTGQIFIRYHRIPTTSRLNIDCQ